MLALLLSLLVQAPPGSTPNDLLMRAPLVFEEPHGQVPEGYDLVARAAPYALALSRTRVLLAPAAERPQRPLELELVGARSGPGPVVEQPQALRVSSFRGSDPAAWRRGMRTFGRVRYEQVWPGIDVVYHGDGRLLEYDFVVAPGADPSAIRLRFGGAAPPTLSEAGELLLETEWGTLVQAAPHVYQPLGDDRCDTVGGFVIEADGTVRFELGDYDRARPLVIDPVIDFSVTIAGGSPGARAVQVAIDGQGNTYVVAEALWPSFPLTLGSAVIRGLASEVILCRFDVNGVFDYYAWLGGNGIDRPTDVSVDPAGAVYVCGHSASTDFPVTAPGGTPWQPAFGGILDAFVFKLDVAADQLVYSTYLGGVGNDRAESVVADGSGRACVVGSAQSNDFPLWFPARAAQVAGEAFVTLLEPDGESAVFSTFWGGNGSEEAMEVLLEPAGTFLISGQWQPAGDQDVFLARVDVDGGPLLERSYGGSGDEFVKGMDRAPDGRVFLCGNTESPDLILVDELQGASGDLRDAFVASFEPVMFTTTFSSYVGSGMGVDCGEDLAFHNDFLTLALTTRSPALPLVGLPLGKVRGGSESAYLLELDLAQAQPTVTWSSYLTSGNDNSAAGLATDAADVLYVTGTTANRAAGGDFPATVTVGGGNLADDAVFLMRISPDERVGAGQCEILRISGASSRNVDYPFFVYRQGANSLPTEVFYSVSHAGVTQGALGGSVVFDAGQQMARGVLPLAANPTVHPYLFLQLEDTTNGATIGKRGNLTIEIGVGGGGGGGGNNSSNRQTCCLANAVAGESWLQGELPLLRRFRDRVLRRSTVGRALTRAYYDKGGWAVELVQTHPHLAPVVRGGMWPLVQILKHPFQVSLACALLALWLARRGLRRPLERPAWLRSRQQLGDHLA